MLGVTSVAATLCTILAPSNNLDSGLSTVIMSLGSTIDQMKNCQENMMKEIELVRKTRTNWSLIINLPLPFGITKAQAIQNLFAKLSYEKPVFDAERGILATYLLYVSRADLLYNISIFLAQRHYEHVMAAPFQKAILAYKKTLDRMRPVIEIVYERYEAGTILEIRSAYEVNKTG